VHRCPAPYRWFALIMLLSPVAVHAGSRAAAPGHDRGVWFWQSPKSPFGSVAIVGDAKREDETIANLKKLGITTVYGSYVSSSDQDALRRWNAKLAANRISSYLLLSETEYVYPERWAAASNILLTNFVQFNHASRPSERFAGVAFDIEPHILPASPGHASWKSADGAERRLDLAGLLTFLQKTRALMDANGEKNARMESTLTTWFYKLNENIQWRDSADRDGWFTQLSQVCDRVSIMDFEIASISGILDRVQEEGVLLHGKARIALRANAGKEWQSSAAFWIAVHTVESQTGQSIDIQDYALLMTNQGIQ